MNPSTAVLLTDLLTREHRLIQRGAVALARLCAHVRHGGELDPDVAGEFVRFFRDYADDHHHAKEEDILFPWMKASGFMQGAGPIEVMLMDHCQSREHMAAMDAARERVRASADDQEARELFIRHGEAYATLLWQHIWKEDNILYPMAERLGPGTAGLYDPAGDSERDTAAVETEFGALIEGMEARATGWPQEDVQWPQGCH